MIAEAVLPTYCINKLNGRGKKTFIIIWLAFVRLFVTWLTDFSSNFERFFGNGSPPDKMC